MPRSVRKNKSKFANKMIVEKTELIDSALKNIEMLFGLKMQYHAFSNAKGDLLDGVIRIDYVHFGCLVYQRVTQYNINSILSLCMRVRNAGDLPILVIAGEINTGLMQRLHENDIHVMDSAGNCYIQYDKLMVFCQGQKNVIAAGKETLSFKDPGLKVLYFVLSDLSNINLPFRDIQAQTGVGLATISKLFSSLKQSGYLFISSTGRHLKKTEGLLNVFVDNYCRVMKPKAKMATMDFLPGGRERWAEMILPKGMQWGGEPGAYLYDKFLLPEIWEIYSSVASTSLITSRIAIPARDGKIRVYRKFWIDNNESTTAPALIVYADLMGSGDDRCIEAAQRILNHELSYLR